MLAVWHFFLKKREFTILVIAGLTLWGAAAAIAITKESTPEVQIPMGLVTTVLPGASSEDVERLVTNKLEEHLANLENLNKLSSVSSDSVSVVTVEFAASADLQKSIQKLKDEVDKAKSDLPEDAKTPLVTDVNFVDQPIQIISVTADLPPAQFASLAESVKEELQTVPGVSRVDVSGVRDREVQVVVRKEALARLSVSLGQVVAGVAAANASIPVGSLTVDDVSYSIAFKGSLDNVSDIGSVAILNVAGQVIYLRDIADVYDSVEAAKTYSRVSINGEPSRQAMTLMPHKVRGYDVTTVSTAVKKKLHELQDGLLKGSDVIVTFDRGDQVRKDLGELTRTGALTVLLVMLALFATIGWREALVAGLSIPLSFTIAFIALLYTGNTLNIVSLFSLILGIGILVDSGIVVVEAIHTRVRLFGDKEKAAREALREYSWPLIGGTMTTVAVFAPLFFISGIVGKFISSIPFTIIFVLIASIFVALGLVPTITNLFSAPKHSRLQDMQEEYAEKSREWYTAELTQFLRNRRAQNRFLWGMLAAFIIALLLPITGIMKTSFFPGGDNEFLYVDIEMPAGTDLNRTDLAARAVEEVLYGDKRFASIVTTVGAPSQFSGGIIAGTQGDSRFANITINLVKGRRESSTSILQDVKSKLAPIHVAEIRAGQPTGGPPVGAAILIKFLGKDQNALDDVVTKARSVLEGTPGATSVNSSNKFAGTQFTLSIDRGKLAELGLSPAVVASTLRTAVSGVTATKLTGGEKDVNIVVSLNLNPNYTDPHDASHASVESLRQIPIATPTGRVVLLGSVLKEGITRSYSQISHEGRQRLATLTGDVLPGYTTGEVVSEFGKRMKAVELPAGITMAIGGENEETNKSFAEMGYALIAGLGLMFIILVLAFNSFRFTAYLLSIVPLSLIGVFGGLTLVLQPLSFPSMMGIIALAGVIINHAIILMDAIIKRMKDGKGRQFIDIVAEAATTRLRPIVLTTITTVVGMIPLTFASALFGPLALSILFGLTFAMILTLVLIPTLVYRWPGKKIKTEFGL